MENHISFWEMCIALAFLVSSVLCFIVSGSLLFFKKFYDRLATAGLLTVGALYAILIALILESIFFDKTFFHRAIVLALFYLFTAPLNVMMLSYSALYNFVQARKMAQQSSKEQQ